MREHPTTAVVQARDDRGDIGEGGEKWADLEYTLKMESTGLANRLDKQCETEKGMRQQCPKVFGLSNGECFCSESNRIFGWGYIGSQLHKDRAISVLQLLIPEGLHRARHGGSQ